MDRLLFLPLEAQTGKEKARGVLAVQLFLGVGVTLKRDSHNPIPKSEPETPYFFPVGRCISRILMEISKKKIGFFGHRFFKIVSVVWSQRSQWQWFLSMV